MKVKTNLSPDELEKVGHGMVALAAKQRPTEIVLENSAERELMRKVDLAFDNMLESLQDEFRSILLENE